MASELMNPRGKFHREETPLAARPGLGAGTVVGLFCNQKKNADVLLDNVEDLLRRSHEGLEFLRFDKEASEPAPFTEDFLGRVDVVVAALAD